MLIANVCPAHEPESQPAPRFYGAEDHMPDHPTAVERDAIAVLLAMAELERHIAPLRPMGLADDRTIATQARLGLYVTRQALKQLRAAGLVDSCLGYLRWSLTDAGRAAAPRAGGAA